jgi:hypothetical protein
VGEFDEIVSESAEVKAERTEVSKVEALRSRWSREEAIRHGAALGLQTATQKGETGMVLDQRVARAKAYAAWEYDGKPTGGAHLVEFGVVQPKTYLPSWLGADTKPEKRK